MSNPAQVFLDGLRRMVAVHYPDVKAVQSDSAYRIGEDRYEVAPKVSLHVQAPVWPSGGPRKGQRLWRFVRYRGPAKWACTGDVSVVYRAISELAERAGHTDMRGGNSSP